MERVAPRGDVERLVGRPRRRDAVNERLENPGRQTADGLRVLDDEDRLRSGRARGGGARYGALCRRRVDKGEEESERRPGSGLAEERDVAAALLDDSVDGGEA